jgi:hypothetical protein
MSSGAIRISPVWARSAQSRSFFDGGDSSHGKRGAVRERVKEDAP